MAVTDVVKCGDILEHPIMGAKRTAAKKAEAEKGQTSVRATITFPAELYTTLEKIAKEKKVSLAWVVREAAEKYLDEKWPLFGGSKEE